MSNFKKYDYKDQKLTILELFKLPECKALNIQRVRDRLYAGHRTEIAIMANIPKGTAKTEEAYLRKQKVKPKTLEERIERDRIKAIMSKPPHPETIQYGLIARAFETGKRQAGDIRSSGPEDLGLGTNASWTTKRNVR